MRELSRFVGVVCLSASVAGCGGEEATKLAPTATASTLSSSAPKTADAKKYTADTGASMVGFMMEAPDEKIRGKALQAVEGTVFIDPTDLSQTTGNIAADLDKLELYQQVKDDAGDFTAEQKHLKQNDHARAWLQIDPTAPEPDRTKNRRVEFKIESVEGLAEKDVTKLGGAERTVGFTVTGEFLLHQHTSKKTVEMQATFSFDGDKITGVTLKTAKPFAVGLAEHDVRPRESFGKIAAKTLEALGSKVAKEAQVSFEIRLMPEGGAVAVALKPDDVPVVGAPSPEASAAPAASAGPAPK